MPINNRNQVIYSTYALASVGHKKWSIISENVNENSLFYKTLYQLGGNTLNQKNNSLHSLNFVTCGEEMYELLRPELIKNNILQSLSKTKVILPLNVCVQPKKITKKDQIIQTNKKKKLFDDLQPLLKSDYEFSTNNITYDSKFVEILYVKIMIHCKKLFIEYDKLTKEHEAKLKFSKADQLTNVIYRKQKIYKKIYEFIVGCSKLLKDKNNTSCNLCCLDLIDWVDFMKNYVSFTIEQVINFFPEMIFKSSYDKLMSNNVVKLYNSQKNVLDLVKSSNNYLGLVHTMLGSGKTTLVLPICGFLTSSLNKNKTRLIFCCPNEIVLLEVANMVYGIGVHFAIVIYNKNKENCIEYKWSSFCDKKDPKKSTTLYICDTYTTRLLLEEYNQKVTLKEKYMAMNKINSHDFPLDPSKIPEVPDYILMCDEVTKDADTQINCGEKRGYSLTTEFFIEIMKLAPPKVILMSATLPPYDSLKQVYDKIVEKHENMKIHSFSSNEAKIGCSLMGVDGKLYAPHLGAQCKKDILQTMEKIKTNPFMGRFYNFEILVNLIKLFRSNNLPTPDITDMITNPSTANQINIQAYALDMLKILSECETSIITSVCSDIGKDDCVNFDNIFTTEIDKFVNGTLIFASNPVSVALDFYKRNFQNNSKTSIFEKINMEKIIKNYTTKMEVYQKKLDKEIKEKIKNTKNIENCKNLSQITESQPKWDFPLCYQLYSKEHLEMFKYTDVSKKKDLPNFDIPKIEPRLTIGPHDLPLDSRVSFDILTLLSSGIGIYSLNNNDLDDVYLKSVILLAKRGLIKFIFADSSIAYGTNLSVSDIIIVDDIYKYKYNNENNENLNKKSIIDNHSLKTIFQMLGRAGRGGSLSYQAKIRTTSNENLINKISLYCKDELVEGEYDEILNIMNAFKSLW